MGAPVSSLKQFEVKTRYNRKNWAIIIFANAASDSRAVKYVIHNFHKAALRSFDTDFYLPGYDIHNLYSGFDQEESEWGDQMLSKKLSEEYQDYHGEDSFRYGVLLGIEENRRNFFKTIDIPRLGPIVFNEAEFTDFIMELNRRNPGYHYMGTCQMNIVPIFNGQPDFSRIRSYDLDAIIDNPSEPSLESFFHHVEWTIQKTQSYSKSSLLDRLFRRRYKFLVEIDQLYEEVTMYSGNDERYEMIIKNVIVDMERRLHWSLQKEYYYISYSSKNVQKAAMIGRLLQDNGKHVWIAPDGIPQGREYSLVVPTALKLAKYFVCLLTPESARSNWVKRELDIAISNENNTKVIVLLADGYRIDNIQNDNDLMFYLNRVQIKYEYEDVVTNPDALERFMSE